MMKDAIKDFAKQFEYKPEIEHAENIKPFKTNCFRRHGRISFSGRSL